jgi:hypothetical protein
MLTTLLAFLAAPAAYLKPEVQQPKFDRLDKKCLWDAAQLIRKHGWTVGRFESPTGELCALGAMSKAVTGDAAGTVQSNYRYSADQAQILHNAVCLLSVLIQDDSVAYWNDNEARSPSEVISAMEKAALS